MCCVVCTGCCATYTRCLGVTRYLVTCTKCCVACSGFGAACCGVLQDIWLLVLCVVARALGVLLLYGTVSCL